MSWLIIIDLILAALINLCDLCDIVGKALTLLAVNHEVWFPPHPRSQNYSFKWCGWKLFDFLVRIRVVAFLNRNYPLKYIINIEDRCTVSVVVKSLNINCTRSGFAKISTRPAIALQLQPQDVWEAWLFNEILRIFLIFFKSLL